MRYRNPTIGQSTATACKRIYSYAYSRYRYFSRSRRVYIFKLSPRALFKCLLRSNRPTRLYLRVATRKTRHSWTTRIVGYIQERSKPTHASMLITYARSRLFHSMYIAMSDTCRAGDKQIYLMKICQSRNSTCEFKEWKLQFCDTKFTNHKKMVLEKWSPGKKISG